MIRTILSLTVVAGLVATASVQAEPPAKKNTKSKNQTTSKTAVVPGALTNGWSLVNGVWTHSDGYKFVNGQVTRVGTQTHKRPPKAPTKAEMDVATRKNNRPQTPAEASAAKASERERNLAPRPASQTGTHL